MVISSYVIRKVWLFCLLPVIMIDWTCYLFTLPICLPVQVDHVTAVLEIDCYFIFGQILLSIIL